MSRWIGLAADPNAGGSTYDDVEDGGGTIAAATEFYPVTTAQVDVGLTTQDRNDEVRGRRGNTAPRSFASAPSLTFAARAYPALTNALVRRALGGAVGTSGSSPAAITSTVTPLQEGNLPASIGTLVREGQTDRLTGLVVESFELNFPVDEEGTIEVTMPGLFHRVDPTSGVSGLPTPDYTANSGDTYKLRDAQAFVGPGAGVAIDCLAGFGLTFDNGLIDEFRSRFCAGRNVAQTVLDGQTYRTWYPDRHKLGPQQVSGRLDFGDVRPDRELRRILTHAEKLVFEVGAGPLSTTPAAESLLRLTLSNVALTGGGADPLAREGDQVSSYEFTAYVDTAGANDVQAQFVAAAAVA
jgi:hypothetical protein